MRLVVEKRLFGLSLPPWNQDRVLPEGAWETDLDGVYERFVEDAPNRAEREILFAATELHLKRMERLIGPSTVWLDGGFSMRKNTVPGDVDLVFFPDDVARLESLTPNEIETLGSLLTLQGVSIQAPFNGGLRRIQPMGGLVDAFLEASGNVDYWRDLWSNVQIDGVVLKEIKKGFAEVRI